MKFPWTKEKPYPKYCIKHGLKLIPHIHIDGSDFFNPITGEGKGWRVNVLECPLVHTSYHQCFQPPIKISKRYKASVTKEEVEASYFYFNAPPKERG